MRSAALLLFLGLLTPGFASVFAQSPIGAGVRLADVLEVLNDRGFRIIYATDVVTEDLVLDSEPDEPESAEDLRTILQPFNLDVLPGPSGSLLIVRQTENGARRSGLAEVQVPEPPIPEIIVASSLHRLEFTRPAEYTYLDSELATRIPVAGDEAVRLTNRLPGTASGGISSRNHIRGGETNEMLFLFDGLRLYEPYHLKDFHAIATIINSNAIGGMDFYSGAYPAQYGDRMSGVLSIDLREPVEPMQTELALSFFNASAVSLGTFGAEQQGDWLVSARRGVLDLLIDVVDPEFGSPVYQDYLAHVGWEFGPRSRVSANLLISDDKIRLVNLDRGESASARYANDVFWVNWLADWSPALSSETVVAMSDITDRRVGTLDLPGIVSGTLDDFGEFRVVEFRQDWNWVKADDLMLRIGVNLKDLDASYRFNSEKIVEAPFDAILQNSAESSIDASENPGGAQYAAYTELRWRFSEKWVIDAGLRWDQQNYTTAQDDKQYSPRASLLYRPNRQTEVRFGWGQYHQAQEINELQISDGLSAFFPAQRAEHFVLNVRHSLTRELSVSASAYRKSFRTIRPRFENLFSVRSLLPELQFDRFRVDASNAESLGAEISLMRGSSEDDLMWWLGYTWAEVEDQTAAGWTRRAWDQTHTFKGGISWRLASWEVSLAGEFHTGWPTTVLYGDLVSQPDGSPLLSLDVSDRNGLRYGNFHGLDLRVGRDFDINRGDLSLYLEVTNLFDRANPCCTEYSVDADGALSSREAHWLPLLPSLGVIWRF